MSPETVPAPSPTRDRILRLAELELTVGLRRSRIADLIKRGDFPKPRQLSDRAIGWRESDVLAWVASRPEAGSTTPAVTAES